MTTGCEKRHLGGEYHAIWELLVGTAGNYTINLLRESLIAICVFYVHGTMVVRTEVYKSGAAWSPF